MIGDFMTQMNLFGETAKKIDTYKLPDIDIHLCGTIPIKIPWCCISRNYGFQLGMRSDKNCNCGNCKINFVDCDFMKYDFDKHIKKVEDYRPNYTAIRDYFSREQATKLGIEFYDIDQIISMAEDLHQYVPNIIVIPKSIKALHELVENKRPYWVFGKGLAGEKFGKTPSIPIEEYLPFDIKIHILGGNPEKQVENYNKAKDKVISMDSAFLATHVINKLIYNPWKSNQGYVDLINRDMTIPSNSYASFNVCLVHNLTNYYKYLSLNMERFEC